MAWLTNSIELEIVESILWMDTTYEIWKELQHIYHQSSLFRVSDLQEETFLLRQDNQQLLERGNYWHIPTSTYTIRCLLLLPTIKEYKENDYVNSFLKGLTES